MSLIVGIRAAEGLVLATDSLSCRDDAVYFTARKLFTFPAQPHVAVAARGLLSLGRGELRPIAVLMDEFSAQLDTQALLDRKQRLPTAMFAAQLGQYLANIWHEGKQSATDPSLELIVAGYDLGMPYGEIYRLQIPNQPEPALQRPTDQLFFAAYWGHTPGVRAMVEPYSFPFDIMPLQDCADLAAHLISSTAQLEAWSSKPQRIGGPVDVVAITHITGVNWVRQKTFWQDERSGRS